MANWQPISTDFFPKPSALTNVVPFSWSSGRTYNEMLEDIYEWVMYTLVPFINSNTQEWSDDTDRMIQQITEAVNMSKFAAEEADSARDKAMELRTEAYQLMTKAAADNERLNRDRNAMVKQISTMNFALRKLQELTDEHAGKVQDELNTQMEKAQAVAEGITQDSILAALIQRDDSQFAEQVKHLTGTPDSRVREFITSAAGHRALMEVAEPRFGVGKVAAFVNFRAWLEGDDTPFHDANVLEKFSNMQDLGQAVEARSKDEDMMDVIFADIGLDSFQSDAGARMAFVIQKARERYPFARIWVCPIITSLPLTQTPDYDVMWSANLRRLISDLEFISGVRVIPGWSVLGDTKIGMAGRNREEILLIHRRLREWLEYPSKIHFPAKALVRKNPVIQLSGAKSSPLASYYPLRAMRVDERVSLTGGYQAGAAMTQADQFITLDPIYHPLGRVQVPGWSSKKGTITFTVLNDGTIRPEFNHVKDEIITLSGEWDVI